MELLTEKGDGRARKQYQAVSIIGKGTFGRVYAAVEKPTIENALQDTSNSLKHLVVKECSLLTEWMMYKSPDLGKIRYSTNKPRNAATDVALLEGRVLRNRELQALHSLSTVVNPLTKVDVSPDGSVTISEFDKPIIPRFVNAFFTLEQGAANWLEATQKGEREYKDAKAVGKRKDFIDYSGNISLVTISESFGTDLYSFTQKNAHMLRNPAFLREVIRQLTSVFADLHSKGLAHRDFKPHNALIEITGEGFPLVRLCDVGSAKKLAGIGDRTVYSTPYICSRYYRAPELLCGSLTYGLPADMWALGVSIAEIVMLSASLYEIPAAKMISLQRSTGRLRDSRTEKHAATLSNPPTASTDTTADFGPRLVLDKTESSIRSQCTIFHGATNDGAQLLHIINLLGTPTEKELAGMQLHSSCEEAFQNVIRTVVRAAGTNVDRDCTGSAYVPSIDLTAFLVKRYVPADLADLIVKMLRWDPRDRITAAEALEHESLTSSVYIPRALLLESNRTA